MKAFITRKLATAALLLGSVVALATLGDGGGGRKNSASARLLSYKPTYNYRSFSLKTGYQYRGSFVFSPNAGVRTYAAQPTNLTFQRGNKTYIVPLKRQILNDKIKIGPVNARY